jgi:hypothetical protein
MGLTQAERAGRTYEELIILTSWMADNDYSAEDIAYAVEKPFKYADELEQAKRTVAAAEAAER